ncbi:MULTISPECIES: PLD nuclease N-terminal domain-containing protein [unclassified Exiguobacterium]|uniref:PLD nuclease N-terminal domain-containing protein n=1 Tax=unclassified Exiguobacterium TaxID=2644629 RepID=UPI000B589C16|nr:MULTISPECIES: PLD nuclease N-terminal domain-containing protein [unclassified Exiguobacterium]ASI35263.1 transcriptional regulator [Exiguobacterium sp. N4-1P]ASI37276.1 transcriptional regulator [Exiguobacterium sp. N4-1P]
MNHIQSFLQKTIYLTGFCLLAVACIDLFKRQQTRGPKWVWGLTIFSVNYIGPLLYLAWGRHPADNVNKQSAD